jgi:hypothetical protein
MDFVIFNALVGFKFKKHANNAIQYYAELFVVVKTYEHFAFDEGSPPSPLTFPSWAGAMDFPKVFQLVLP